MIITEVPIKYINKASTYLYNEYISKLEIGESIFIGKNTHKKKCIREVIFFLKRKLKRDKTINNYSLSLIEERNTKSKLVEVKRLK